MVAATDNWAVKHRPFSLKDFVGQDSAVEAIRGMLKRGEVPKTLLISGSTGMGKTTLARIFASKVKGLDKPGPHMDIIEENAANERGIDAVRALIENMRYLPTTGKYKIYILDEVHTWTSAAVMAMLKPLEEPPPHVIFVLVTNEPHKLPPTVIRRCVRINLQQSNPKDIIPAITRVAKKEGVFQPNVKYASLFEKVAEAAGGQPAQALQILQALADRNAINPIKASKDVDKAIVGALKRLGIGNEELAVNLLVALYRKKKTAVSMLYDTDEYQSLISQALFLNTFLIEIYCGRHTWRNASRNMLESALTNSNFKPTLSMLTTVQEGLTTLASRLIMSMSVSDRSIAVGHIGRILLTIAKETKDE